MDRRIQDPPEERLAWLGLAVIPELGPRLALELIGRFGNARAVTDARAEELIAAGVSESIVPAVRDGVRRGRAEAASLAATGATFITRSDAGYPVSLRELPDPPLTLAVRGRLAGPDELAIAIVGTRRASEYGRRVARELAGGLAQAGVTVVSGLAAGVEAAEQSGSLITAAFALEQNRQVYAVPGPVGVAGHRGPNRLIQQGARLITAVEDILDDFSPALRSRLAERRTAAAEATLTAPERRILEAIGSDGRHVDEVIRHAAVPVGAALETLLALELRGLVHQLPGKRFCRHAA
jgi:predicted Rossmann fold nucleotide-binding protein DprA/Smf involved in DNA uptake